MPHVFDRHQIRRQRNRAAPTYVSYNFLTDWTMDQIGERLLDIKKTFPVCVQIGARGKHISPKEYGIELQVVSDSAAGLLRGRENAVLCEEEFLPFKPQSIDLIVSALNLHTVNDLPGTLLQMNRALKPDGFMIAGMVGGETLYELRQCLSEAELETSGGVSPRVAPFADKQQMGALLQRAGFTLPVVDSEIVTVTYESIFHLMRDLRLMGEGNAIDARYKTFSKRAMFMRAGEIYAQKFSDQDGRIRATFEIIFLAGWAHHDSQQKPLRPGSAEKRLADILGTREIGTGEKPGSGNA